MLYWNTIAQMVGFPIDSSSDHSTRSSGLGRLCDGLEALWTSQYYSTKIREAIGRRQATDTSSMDDSATTGHHHHHHHHRRASSIITSSLLPMTNPYNSLRHRHEFAHSSMTAVRSLLSTVRDENRSLHSLKEELDDDESEVDGLLSQDHCRPPPSRTNHGNTFLLASLSPTETASQLAEGTLRALRDLALDEAVQLNHALRHWNHRWERPLLSWLEAGPWVWFSEGGYNHQLVGDRVSQIQAVLVRRCAAIGELQQHLLLAGWQRGVAQWGFLGQGSQWAAVAGFDVRAAAASSTSSSKEVTDNRRASALSSTHTSQYLPKFRTMSDDSLFSPRLSVLGEEEAVSMHPETPKANIFVNRTHGGGIFVDDPGLLAEWSVEAMSLVRHHLNRSTNGALTLPYQVNWGTGDLPTWACVVLTGEESYLPGSPQDQRSKTRLSITNMSLLAMEVEATVEILEEAMQIQRRRRLDKLKPPSWIRRNWYLLSAVVPSGLSAVFWFMRLGRGHKFLRSVAHSCRSFFREHLRDPITSIFNEFVKGHEDLSNQKARSEAIAALKKMIFSWLSDTYPEMAENEQAEMADAMDMSLIELKKEESMRTFYEVNNVIRMSFIEMQYMKKEMMKALYAMDEMMSANQLNMNIAAITPVLMVSYTLTRLFRFLFYAFLKLGKSREEVYSSFRKTLLDIERLLVMRDIPTSQTSPHHQASHFIDAPPPSRLGPDDLGMLMLLVHECRTMLWQSRRRFSRFTIESVTEDLAELSGERGLVGIQQQLRIVSRMCRTYPFLKIAGTEESGFQLRDQE